MNTPSFSSSQVLAQIPTGPPRRRSVVELHELHRFQDDIPPLIIRGAWCIPAVMWRDIVKVCLGTDEESLYFTVHRFNCFGEV